MYIYVYMKNFPASSGQHIPILLVSFDGSINKHLTDKIERKLHSFCQTGEKNTIFSNEIKKQALRRNSMQEKGPSFT